MSILQRYQEAIWQVVKHSGGQDKFAHTYLGLAIWLVAALVLRRPRGAMLPLLIVIAAEIVNECVDRVTHRSWRWPDTLTDMAASWFWPVVLTLVDRRRTAPRTDGAREEPRGGPRPFPVDSGRRAIAPGIAGADEPGGAE